MHCLGLSEESGVGRGRVWSRTSLPLPPPSYWVVQIHEGYGVTSNGTTLFANASTCTLAYRPTNPALVFDLVPPRRAGAEAGGVEGGSSGAA
jgi:hypothetical protein